MKKFGKGLCVTAMTAILVSAITACSGNSGGSQAETKALGADAQKTLSVLVEAGSPAFDAAEKSAKEFEEKTGTKVMIEAVPYSGIYDKLSAEVTSQAGLYDVACVDTVWLAGLKSGLQPLDGVVTDEMRDDFPESLLTDATLGGELYGLPAWANCKVLVYRTDLFEDENEKVQFKEKYGYELQVPTTWNEYQDAAEFFTRDTNSDGMMDMYGTSLSGKTGGDTVVSFLDMAVQAGASPLVMDENNQILIDEMPYVEALKHMKTLYDNQSVPAGIFEIAAADHSKMFCEGKLAMAPVWCAMYANTVNPESSQVADRVGVTTMPAGPEGVGIVPAPFYHVILKGSQKQDLAAAYLNFMNEKNDLYIARGMAGRISVLEENMTENPQLKVLLDSMQSKLSSGRPKSPQWNEMESAINSTIQKVLKGEQSPEEGVSELKKQLESMF